METVSVIKECDNCGRWEKIPATLEWCRRCHEWWLNQRSTGGMGRSPPIPIGNKSFSAFSERGSAGLWQPPR